MAGWRFALVAAFAWTLSACVSLPNPIGASVGFKNDPALDGLWYGKTDKDSDAVYYHVLLNADNTITVLGVSPHSVKDKGWGVLTATTAILGNNRYINAREVFENGKPISQTENPRAWYSGLYRLEGDVLTIYALDDRKVAAEVKAHRIAGTISHGRFGDDIAITADAAHVDKWLSTPDAPKLFAPLFTLVRIKEPAPPPTAH
jgi:hypothetical protein